MKNSGLTITEMMVTLFILVILLAIGAPSFQSFIGSSNMVSTTNGMIGAFNYARMEAIKRGNKVRVDQLDGSTWQGGIVVWIDLDADPHRSADEELRVWEKFYTGSSVSSTNSRTSFIFQASGEVDNNDVLTICDDRSGEEGREISILVSGAVVAEKVICG